MNSYRKERILSLFAYYKHFFELNEVTSTNFRLIWVTALLVITKGRVVLLSFCDRALGSSQTLLKNEIILPKKLIYRFQASAIESKVTLKVLHFVINILISLKLI